MLYIRRLVPGWRDGETAEFETSAKSDKSLQPILNLPMSEAARSSHDYTEGATEAEIDSALHTRRRERRDSQVSASYGEDDEGAVFDGPGHYVVPSSVTNMHHERPLARRASGQWTPRSRRRRRSEDRGSQGSYLARRASEDTQPSGSNDEDEAVDEDGVDIATSYSGRRSRRRESRASRSVFENIASLFARSSSPTRSRRSLSRASSGGSSFRSRRSGLRIRSDGSDYAVEDEEGSDRWGYSSPEEELGSLDGLLEEGADIVESTSDIDYGSQPPSPTASLPLLSNDHIFDDTRIDMEDLARSSSPRPPPGPPSRQRIHLADEDTTVRFLGYEIMLWRKRLWTLCCVVTFGALGLVGHWFPRVWLRWAAREKAFKDIDDGLVVVEV